MTLFLKKLYKIEYKAIIRAKKINQKNPCLYIKKIEPNKYKELMAKSNIEPITKFDSC